MPELRDDTTDDGFHEIQFSSKQLVFLFMAASAILISVFIFGVLVGRDTTTSPPEEPIAGSVSAPVDPPPALAENAPPETKTTEAPEVGGVSYPKTLTEDPSKPNPSTANPPIAAAQPPEPRSEAPAPAAQPDPKPTQADVPKPQPPPVSKPANEGPKVPTTGKPGQWVLQVSALRTRQAAAESVQRLISKGYDAYLEDTAKGLYRVRIGKFKDREEALRVARRYEKEEGTKLAVQR